MKEKKISEELRDFISFVDDCRSRYQAAYDAVGMEDRRLQDLLHALEFADGEKEKRKASTKLRQSRQERRRAKDELKRLEAIVEFFNESPHKGTLNKMKQILGKQRNIWKEKEYTSQE